MERIDPKEREQGIFGRGNVYEGQSPGKRSTEHDLEKEAADVDTYVNCDPLASWEHLSSTLYRHHLVAAVEDMRSYLPPRGN